MGYGSMCATDGSGKEEETEYAVEKGSMIRMTQKSSSRRTEKVNERKKSEVDERKDRNRLEARFSG